MSPIPSNPPECFGNMWEAIGDSPCITCAVKNECLQKFAQEKLEVLRKQMGSAATPEALANATGVKVEAILIALASSAVGARQPVQAPPEGSEVNEGLEKAQTAPEAVPEAPQLPPPPVDVEPSTMPPPPVEDPPLSPSPPSPPMDASVEEMLDAQEMLRCHEHEEIEAQLMSGEISPEDAATQHSAIDAEAEETAAVTPDTDSSPPELEGEAAAVSSSKKTKKKAGKKKPTKKTATKKKATKKTATKKAPVKKAKVTKKKAKAKKKVAKPNPTQAGSVKSAKAPAKTKTAKSAKTAKAQAPKASGSRKGKPHSKVHVWGEHTYPARWKRERKNMPVIGALTPGTKLTRQFKGATYKVTVKEGHYLYCGKKYPTLYSITKEITGTTEVHSNGRVRHLCAWSATRFWNLDVALGNLGNS